MTDLEVRSEGSTWVVTLNRPKKRNAFSLEMLESLEATIDKASQDESVAAVIITGAGPEAFSSGMDLGVLLEHVQTATTGAQIRRVQRELQALFCRLEELEKPAIAAVEGLCVGGGLELALACDFRVVSEAAQLGFPEIKLGMIPDLGGTTRLTRLCGPAVAKEWVLTGRFFPARRAHEQGVVTELVPQGAALDRALALSAELAGGGLRALGWAKRIIDRGCDQSLGESLQLEQDAMTELLPSGELSARIQAFLARRPAGKD